MNYYDTLGVSGNASGSAIRTAYRRLARLYHPDIVGTGSAEKFREVQEAYDTLREQSRRQAYDMTLREQPRRVHMTVIRSKTASSRYAEPLVSPWRGYRPSPLAELDQVFNEFFRYFDIDWF
jgi:DnaJ-class molecular chaperone